MLKVYNSLTRQKHDVLPVNEDGVVRMYTCGPTVYYYAHIGNLRSYLFMDFLRRVLKFNSYKLLGVMNITDVGHLTSDEDTGEDKMEVSAKRENRSVYEIAEHYTNFFMRDCARLNIDMPEHVVKATDHIPEMIDIVSALLEKGYAYTISDGIYFDTSKFADYGKLSGQTDKQAGARIEVNEEKRNPADFALWKKVDPSHIMKWDSPWGLGCPGWHIECSAMSKKYLGNHFDIHTGGIDHLPVHHENEIAQNDCLEGHRVVDIWMHGEFLQVDGGKMSKSLRNLYTIDDLVERGYSPLDYRYFCLNTHYHKKLNFTFDGLNAAKTALERLKAQVNSNKGVKRELTAEEISKLTKYNIDFTSAINDDLNLPLALGTLWNMLKDLPKSEDVYELAIKMDSVLGLDLDKEVVKQVEEIPQEVIDLAEERKIARSNKDYAKSDELRDKIASLGYAIKDSASGYELTKK